jgi:hypothetical protein
MCGEVPLVHIVDKVCGHVQSTKRRLCKLGSDEIEDKIVIIYKGKF